jgi:hypothetical protein
LIQCRAATKRRGISVGRARSDRQWILDRTKSHSEIQLTAPIQQLSTPALLIGLPIVLVLAWYHGDRGQQRITTPEFAILT